MLFECCRYNLYKYRIIVALQWPEGCQAEHLNYRNRTMHMHRNRKRCDSFFMVSMASGKDCESIHRKTMSHNMVIILQLIPSLGLQHTCLIYLDIYYGQLSPVKTRYLLTSIAWPYCWLKLWAHQGHMFDGWPSNGFVLNRGLRQG